MKIAIASDHAGVELKAQLIAKLSSLPWLDLGPQSKDSVDYPDYADLVASRIQESPTQRGILICGSGQGMCMRANKYSQVRAALCWNEEITRLCRQHNDANILCLPARFISLDQAVEFVRIFLNTEFEGQRHSSRVAKVIAPTKK